MKRDVQTIDATGKVPGRLASEIAIFLIGKHKADYQPNLDQGDAVEVENAAQMKVSQKKMEQKTYYHHTRYAQGLKAKTMKAVWDEDPAEVLRRAVSRMLPKNKLRNERMKRLTIKN